MATIDVPKSLRAPAVGSWVERHAHFFFVAPAVLVLFALLGFPVLYTVYMSLHKWSLSSIEPPKFIELQNFVRALSTTAFRESVVRTLYFTALGVGASTLLGLIAALVFAQPFRGRGALRTIFILPMLATPVAIALVWQMMFHPTLGVLNYLLSLVGMSPSQWIFSRQTVIPSLVTVETWRLIPFAMLIMLGGLTALPDELLEAATVDGANFLQRFRYVVLPLAWPYIMVAVILICIEVLKTFDTIYVMTQGGPGDASQTINIYLYLQAFSYYHMGYASAVVLLFFMLVAGISVLLIWVRRRTSWQEP